MSNEAPSGSEGTPLTPPIPDFSAWRQADHFEIGQIAVVGDDGAPQVVPTPFGVAIISQSCDVVLPKGSSVQVAPVVRLSGTASVEAREGKRSQYAHLALLGDDTFADLDHIATLSKRALEGRWVARGVDGDGPIRRFSAAIARRFGRFAFPNDVSDAMKILRDLVQSKAGNSASPFRALLEDLVELRAESQDWSVCR